MNRVQTESEFRAEIAKLLAVVDNQFQLSAANPHACARDEVFHERDTRVFFFDPLLELLGWELGAGGHVAQEARIKAGTTLFVDYVGLNANTRTPVLVLEAKAWDTRLIAGKGERRNLSKISLVVEAVRHVNAGGSKESSPVIGEWHEHLSQLAGYVRNFKEKHGHRVSRAVLSSGQWMLIFKDPVSTFCDFDVNDQEFYLFTRDAYVANAHVIFEQLGRASLENVPSSPVSSSQLVEHVNKASFSAAYHGMLICYEESGTMLFPQRPRILIYPAIVIQRADDALVTVIDTEDPIVMQISRRNGDKDLLAPHLNEVAKAAGELMKSCSDELELEELEPGDLVDFPGFPEESVMASRGLSLGTERKVFVQPVRSSPNTWLAVTGKQPHFLHEFPKVACQFHAWAECKAVHQSIGANAVNSPSTKSPRAFFVDGQPHHCANRRVVERREARCFIKAIDARTCCNACVYHEFCWSKKEIVKLPCGK